MLCCVCCFLGSLDSALGSCDLSVAVLALSLRYCFCCCFSVTVFVLHLSLFCFLFSLFWLCVCMPAALFSYVPSFALCWLTVYGFCPPFCLRLLTLLASYQGALLRSVDDEDDDHFDDCHLHLSRRLALYLQTEAQIILCIQCCSRSSFCFHSSWFLIFMILFSPAPSRGSYSFAVDALFFLLADSVSSFLRALCCLCICCWSIVLPSCLFLVFLLISPALSRGRLLPAVSPRSFCFFFSRFLCCVVVVFLFLFRPAPSRGRGRGRGGRFGARDFRRGGGGGGGGFHGGLFLFLRAPSLRSRSLSVAHPLCWELVAPVSRSELTHFLWLFVFHCCRFWWTATNDNGSRKSAWRRKFPRRQFSSRWWWWIWRFWKRFALSLVSLFSLSLSLSLSYSCSLFLLNPVVWFNVSRKTRITQFEGTRNFAWRRKFTRRRRSSRWQIWRIWNRSALWILLCQCFREEPFSRFEPRFRLFLFVLLFLCDCWFWLLVSPLCLFSMVLGYETSSRGGSGSSSLLFHLLLFSFSFSLSLPLDYESSAPSFGSRGGGSGDFSLVVVEEEEGVLHSLAVLIMEEEVWEAWEEETMVVDMIIKVAFIRYVVVLVHLLSLMRLQVSLIPRRFLVISSSSFVLLAVFVSFCLFGCVFSYLPSSLLLLIPSGSSSWICPSPSLCLFLCYLLLGYEASSESSSSSRGGYRGFSSRGGGVGPPPVATAFVTDDGSITTASYNSAPTSEW